MSEYICICVYKCPKCGHRNIAAHIGLCSSSRFFCPRCNHRKKCELQLRVITDIYKLADQLVSMGIYQCDVTLTVEKDKVVKGERRKKEVCLFQ